MTQLPNTNTALVALGKNWELPIPADPTDIRPSFDSRLTARAAGILYTQGSGYISFDKIIFAGARTAGLDYPSEAQGQRNELRRYFDESQIPEDDIILEEERSFDTARSMEPVNEICAELNIGSVGLLTVFYHARRSLKLARKHLDVPVVGVYKSDAIVRSHDNESRHFYARSVIEQARDEHSVSPLVRTAASLALEGAAWGLLAIDPSGEGISSKITGHLRNEAI